MTDYTYLQDLGYDEAQDKIQTKADFQKLELSKAPNVYSCDGFPYDSVKTFLMIPLVVVPPKRDMYWQEWASGKSSPPDCTSYDGIKPIKPLNINGQEITECAKCSLYGFSKNYKCHDAALLMGLAYFPEQGDLLVPFKKAIPKTSTPAINQLAANLNRPVIVGDKQIRLKPYTRIVRVSTTVENKGDYTSAMYLFDLIRTPLPGQPPSQDPPFVPQHLVEQIEKMYRLAQGVVAQYQLPQLEGAEIPLIQNNPYAIPQEVTDFAVTVMSEEEEAGY